MNLRRMDYVHINGEGELVERPRGLLVDWASYEALAAELAVEKHAHAGVVAEYKGFRDSTSDTYKRWANERIALETALRDMVDRWEPDGGSDKRMWDRARELLDSTPQRHVEQGK